MIIVGGAPTSSGQVQTVGSVTSTVCTIDLTSFGGRSIDNIAIACTGKVIARSTGGNAALYTMYALFKRNSGTVSQVGSTNLLEAIADAALSATNYVLDFSGNVIRLRATGVTSGTLEWTGALWAWVTKF